MIFLLQMWIFVKCCFLFPFSFLNFAFSTVVRLPSFLVVTHYYDTTTGDFFAPVRL